ncbi:autotransporter outer membrane beta-barrel domain-containing protein [Fusobacterium ulcerans]|uniref:autotransporter outer membrane beta-barrel domain-containing protein n=1 Tax=Fusobacterium ulcerans TaxID=861 RepID=UPI001D09CC2C|nr:autotransporter outer membrane beta-barrel domain-containing protein [Fusobacterium ulcerans]MCB8565789.1 autotransporter outer membrane beta-barrel domain-containing protein [Fusobacterium ulcerans]MCB8650644.1 autotransporter outer membrane beta-barrel domain-containing protein [Fusobacterium ulcerans]
MREKVMKTVKSGNKKRRRNITVGAVVGMLLSCTVAMGETNVTGLEITDNSGDIEFIGKDGTKFEPGAENAPYPENTWDAESKTYTNNATISGESEDGRGTGINANAADVTIKNNGMISGTSSNDGYMEYGVKIDALKDMENNGLISATSTYANADTYGIYNSSQKLNNIINNGIIRSVNTNGGQQTYGISINASMNDIKNRGLINSNIISSDYCYSHGIKVLSSMGNIKNSGLINSSTSDSSEESLSTGYGIDIYSNGSPITVEEIENSGVIYGHGNAINKSNKTTVSAANNYGLLVSGDSDENVTNGVTIVAHDDTTDGSDKIKNYGLAFIADSSSGSNEYIGGGKSNTNPNIDYHNNFGEIYYGISIDGVDYDIINVDAEVNETSKEITDLKSLSMKDGKLYSDADDIAGSEIGDFSSDKQYILNGIEDTLKISGKYNELNNSTVNAYTTAVVMDEGNSMLTLDNTIVNGGVAQDSSTISITENGSALTVKGDSVINVRDEGVAIKVTGDDNAVVLEGNAIVNGKMEASGDRNILDLDGTGKDGMNMFHDISGFAKMAIDNNVTFFENMKVTGTNEVTVEGTGVLNLRLKKDSTASTLSGDTPSTPPTATHAFSGTDGMTIIGNSPEEAGTLNFITNGIGRVIDVDMTNIALKNMKIKASSIIDKAEIHKDYIRLGAGSDLGGIVNPKVNKYNSLNKIYKSIYNSTDENLDALRDILNITYFGKNYDYNNRTEEEQLANLLSYLNDIYTGTPYSYSSELSRRSVGMFRDVVVDNIFRPETNKWMIMGGLTHADGGTKDTYYGQNYHGVDIGTADTEADMKLTGAYMLAKYGYSENTSLGVTLGGNKSEAELDMAKVKGNSGYLGAFAENYIGNLTLKAGAGVQYSEYDADRRTIGGHSYSDKYSDRAYDIYLNGRYSHNIGNNLFLEPYATLSYTYVDQDGAKEGNKVLAIETDSKSFDYTVGKAGVDIKKVIPHKKGKSTISAGVSYTKIFDGAEEKYIKGRVKGSTTDFDISVAHKNEKGIGVNAKYALELENGVVFDVKGSYSVERDSHNGSGKNKTKGEWIVGVGIGYKF